MINCVNLKNEGIISEISNFTKAGFRKSVTPNGTHLTTELTVNQINISVSRFCCPFTAAHWEALSSSLPSLGLTRLFWGEVLCDRQGN